MDKKTMLQVLLPAGAAAAVVLLVGALIWLGEAGTPGTAKTAAGEVVPADTSGTSLVMPEIASPLWTAGPGQMKVWDVVEGTGDPVKPGASVVCHYTGWTKDGTIFDSSVKRNEPAPFSLNQVIRGWTEGIPGMKPGGIRRLYIPADWAYGDAGRPPKIPGNADLVFEVKLIAVQ